DARARRDVDPGGAVPVLETVTGDAADRLLYHDRVERGGGAPRHRQPRPRGVSTGAVPAGGAAAVVRLTRVVARRPHGRRRRGGAAGEVRGEASTGAAVYLELGDRRGRRRPGDVEPDARGGHGRERVLLARPDAGARDQVRPPGAIPVLEDIAGDAGDRLLH